MKRKMSFTQIYTVYLNMFLCNLSSVKHMFLLCIQVIRITYFKDLFRPFFLIMW
jgi:hypothetical protein